MNEVYEETFDNNCTLTYNKTKSTLTAFLPYKGVSFSATVDLKPYARHLHEYERNVHYPLHRYSIEFTQDNIIFYRIQLVDLHYIISDIVGYSLEF